MILGLIYMVGAMFGVAGVIYYLATGMGWLTLYPLFIVVVFGSASFLFLSRAFLGRTP